MNSDMSPCKRWQSLDKCEKSSERLLKVNAYPTSCSPQLSPSQNSSSFLNAEQK